MIAHLRKTDGEAQPLAQHCRAVSELCACIVRQLGLEQTARLIGLLHDMGKATEEFRAYLYRAWKEEMARSPHHHAPAGAIYVCRRWLFPEGQTEMQRMTAQIVALCIHGHHAGLADCLDENGTSPWLTAMERKEDEEVLAQAGQWFFAHVISEEELGELFEQATAEIEAFYQKIRKNLGKNTKSMVYAQLGLLTRLLLSVLIDADRWDSACFEYRENPFPAAEKLPDWTELLARFETFRKTNLNGSGEINRVRAAVSDECFQNADTSPGIVTLCVPTGGGKTFSSLRYALRHAARNGQQRVFYIIPYNTILDQNAQDIRRALADDPSILEHHSNVVLPETEDGGENGRAQAQYRRLTERWDSGIILTSLVQFLNACYAASNTDARRFFRLTNAVLIFDEIQSLPKHCKTLFERAAAFLSACCGSTVVLCTATQPRLNFDPAPRPLIADAKALCRQLKRVRYLAQLEKPRTCAEAAEGVAALLWERSVLAVVNTKAMAWKLYQETTALLQAGGMTVVEADAFFSEEEILRRARQSAPQEALCVHLSTFLCPAHRKAILAWMKCWLREGKRVLCVSTALIEAGVNISFPVVVRSLAGLPSIVQAAGRANRSMEYGRGDVYLWEFSEEHLNSLPDIQNGGNLSRAILRASDPDALEFPETMDAYFAQEEAYTKRRADCPAKEKGFTLAGLLDENEKCARAARGKKRFRQLMLYQSFRTAGRQFQVIPDRTTAVLVPFGEGRELIAQLAAEHTMEEEIALLRRAQSYCVALYEATLKRLKGQDAVFLLEECGVWALKEGFYDAHGGVKWE